MSGIDQYAYRSRLSRVKAETKLAFTLAVMAVCLSFSSEAVSALTIAAMSAFTVFMGGCRLKSYARLLTVPLAFLLTGTITIMVGQLRDHEPAYVSFHLLGAAYGVSAGSLRAGLDAFLKALGALTCLYFFTLNTPMNAFLSFLRRKAPGLLVTLMELIYRFVFVIWEEAGKIRTAQASRLGYSGFVRSLRSLGELVTGVFLRAFRRVDRVNMALESRGFDGSFELLVEAGEASAPLNRLSVVTVAVLIAVGVVERLLR